MSLPPRRRSISQELTTIRTAFAEIDGVLARLIPLVDETKTQPRGGQAPSKRKLSISPKRRAALKLQGLYMGHMRNLRARQKAQVKALKAAKGYGPAIQLAKKLGRSPA
jgi:hypothetical protein